MDIKREAWTTQLRCAYLLTLMRTSSYGQTKKHITCVKGLVQHVLYVGIRRDMLVLHVHTQDTVGGYLGVKG